MRPALSSLILAALVPVGAGCAGEDFLVITVESRPAVHSPTTLAVKISNGGSEVAQNFEVTAQTFPATFSVGPGLSSSPVTISVEARDGQGLIAGRGINTVGGGASSGKVVLESTDFVVNTDFAGDQVPSNDFEAHGFQVGASSSGNITVVYRENVCPTAGCDIFARRFDSAGRALSSQLAAGTNSFKISSRLTVSSATPAVAASGEGALAVWDYSEPGTGTITGITCRSLDGNGNANAQEVLVSAETSPDVVSVTALSNSNYAIAWSAAPATPREIRGAVVRPDCTLLGVVNTISQTAAVASTRSAVAANATGIMYSWIDDGGVLVRAYRNDLQATSNAIGIVSKTPTEKVEHARIAALGNGFAVVVRWALITGSTGPGRLELFQLSSAGAIMGTPTIVSDKSGSDFDSKQAFGLASRPDGSIMVTWHACDENGDGEGCGVHGRAYGANGQPLGERFVVSTTTQGNQSKPSVAGLPGAFVTIWADESATDPDRAGTSVRARVVYPDGASNTQ